MNITPRTCINCASFNPITETDCTFINGVCIIERKAGQPDVHRWPVAGDCCTEHQTMDETLVMLHIIQHGHVFLDDVRKCLRPPWKTATNHKGQ